MKIARLIPAIFVIVWFAGAAAATSPTDMSYQGLLRDAGGGAPLAGPVDLGIAIWDAPSGGTVVYEETHTGVALNRGVFHISVGVGAPVKGAFDFSTFSEPERHLEVTVNGETLSPRQSVGSVPYTFETELSQDATCYWSANSGSHSSQTGRLFQITCNPGDYQAGFRLNFWGSQDAPYNHAIYCCSP